MPVLNRQLVSLDRLRGADQLGEEFVRSLKRTYQTYSGDTNRYALIRELLDLYDILLACRPRMANLILDLQKTLIFLAEKENAGVLDLSNFTDSLLRLKKARMDRAGEAGAEVLSRGQTILLHSHSRTLKFILEHAVGKVELPDVIVAEQDQNKTTRLMISLKRCGYKFKVVSEYSLSHVLEELDFALFGALTLDSHGNLIVGPGSSALMCQLSRARVPVYLAITTNKLSFWEDSFDAAFSELRKKERAGIEYEKQVFSHDLIPLDVCKGIITERGVLTPPQMRMVFDKMQRAFLDREKLIRSLV